MPENVSSVVQSGLCVGCGVCAGVCPREHLSMEWNSSGEYNPSETGRGCIDCGLCLAVCPFRPGNANEDELSKELFGPHATQHDAALGHYSSTWAGQCGQRIESASGGWLTRVAGELLASGKVDAVACVMPGNGADELFRFGMASSQEELMRARGSAYYPVHVAEVLRYIRKNPGRYAITAMPCLAKALRLASKKLPWLRDRLAFVIGVVCGQMKSRHYTRHLAALAGVDEPLVQCHYRGKALESTAGNLIFSCQGESGQRGRLAWGEGAARAWTHRWFAIPACSYCDDMFAELADASFMDAWLARFEKDASGTSLVVCRNRELESLMIGAAQGRGWLEPIAADEVVKSQAGALRWKRELLAARLALDGYKGGIPLRKRVSPSLGKTGPLQLMELKGLVAMGRSSRLWSASQEAEKGGPKALERHLAAELKLLAVVRRLASISNRVKAKGIRLISLVKNNAGI